MPHDFYGSDEPFDVPAWQTVMRTSLISVVICALASAASPVAAQNAAFPCAGLAGAQKSKCLNVGPPSDAGHAAAAGGKLSKKQPGAPPAKPAKRRIN
jgi:hypothetical protein